MIRIRRTIAIILLGIYSIVFAHNVIPHHHHIELVSNLAAVFDCNEHHHEASTGNYGHHHHSENSTDEEISHKHDHQHHDACHFDVRPVVAKSSALQPVLVLNNYFQLDIPVTELLTQDFVYYPQKLLASYNLAVPLRAPPIFS